MSERIASGVVSLWREAWSMSSSIGLLSPPTCCSIATKALLRSMSRRTTLYKIAEALNLSEKEIITEWAA